MIYLLIWIICGFGAAAIYRSKGRSGAVAFIGGILLGPIGVLLALVSGRSETGLTRQAKEKEERLVQSGEMRKCPFCAELIRPEAKVCRHCGRDLGVS